jgi:ribosomal protein S18 acetylase RimI-like enzyme
MSYDIQFLPPEKWRGYEIEFGYTTAYYYDAVISESADSFGVTFEKKAFDEPVIKQFTELDKLYQPWWEGAQAFGIFDGDNLIAYIQICKEDWSNRLRVTDIDVDKRYQRRGMGKALMDFAKEKAKEMGCRAMMLETQSCNENAIAFYIAQGFSFFGFDRSCYGNKDIENCEVRLELGLYVE